MYHRGWKVFHLTYYNTLQNGKYSLIVVNWFTISPYLDISHEISLLKVNINSFHARLKHYSFFFEDYFFKLFASPQFNCAKIYHLTKLNELKKKSPHFVPALSSLLFHGHIDRSADGRCHIYSNKTRFFTSLAHSIRLYTRFTFCIWKFGLNFFFDRNNVDDLKVN